MTNPTTPFSWQMPTSTDLVTDLPADFETFGQAVATSMADLLGGTSGQVLSKASNTDMDFTWVTSDDANAIQNAIVDAKGDLIAATAADTPARLAVGNNGEMLVADSGASTGLRWTATPSASNPFLNSATQIWQRGTSISLAASTLAYTADRWIVNTPAGCASTITRQATGDTTNLPFIQYCARVQRNSGQTGAGYLDITQMFETLNTVPFAGKTVTLSFYARRGANYSATSNLLTVRGFTGTGTDQNLYSGYTGSAQPLDSTATLTTTWQRFTFTFAIASTATEMAYAFTNQTTGTAGANDYFEITGVQLDIGNAALPFRTYAGTIQGELAACQRYFQRFASGADATNEVVCIGQCYATTASYAVIQFLVPMRTTPTMTISAAGHFAFSDSSGVDKTCTSFAFTGSNSTTRHGRLDFGVASGLTAGNAGLARSINASSTMDLSSEL